MSGNELIILLSLTFMTGVSVGLLIYEIFLNRSRKKIINDEIRKPLLNLMKRGYDIYKFSYRQGDIVTLEFDTKGLVYINIKKQTISVFEGEELLFTNHEYLAEEFQIFYNKLVGFFEDEIYYDVVVVNDVIYSKNLINNIQIEYNYDENLFNEVFEDENADKEVKIYDLDSVLDKINISGFDSLTDEEIKFLNKKSE